jgi:hypothetical protein
VINRKEHSREHKESCPQISLIWFYLRASASSAEGFFSFKSATTEANEVNEAARLFPVFVSFPSVEFVVSETGGTRCPTFIKR